MNNSELITNPDTQQELVVANSYFFYVAMYRVMYAWKQNSDLKTQQAIYGAISR